MSAREGIIKTIREEYMGFRQRAKGPCVISLPAVKYFKKYIAEEIQKIIPSPDQTNPITLTKEKFKNFRSKNSGYLYITINDRIT